MCRLRTQMRTVQLSPPSLTSPPVCPPVTFPCAAATTSRNTPTSTSTKPAQRPIKTRDFAHPTTEPRHYGKSFDPYDGGHRIINELHDMIVTIIEEEKLDRDDDAKMDGEGGRGEGEEEEEEMSPEEFVELILHQEIETRRIMRQKEKVYEKALKEKEKLKVKPQDIDRETLVQMSRDAAKARREKARVMAEAGVEGKQDPQHSAVAARPLGALHSTATSRVPFKAKMASPRQTLARSVNDVSGQAQNSTINGKENKRSVDELAGEGDRTREGLVSKRARMGGEVAAQMRSEERTEGKKRVRDDEDDEVSLIPSGDDAIKSDDQHQEKRVKRSTEGSSISRSSASPRGLGRPTRA
ncbi:hypothetical protein BD410DRAFT_805333 [Rickenella mellea]|uniref:Uncharacterized protein n=1 Tax=Rickenella mellea TaxID=50990 RepID=A0A4Y7PXG4_9AGAM|nr:hypothetical protein BD410DRAFT_805333 [Rickenella mellea]